MKIWIDADAAPRDVKEITARAAKRLELPTVLVANQRLWFPPGNPFLEALRVAGGPDVADAYILEHAEPGDLAITADIPLAALLVEKGVLVLDHRGEEFSESNVGERLSIRNFMDDLRSTGVETGGPAPYGAREKQAFAGALDRTLTRVLRGGDAEWNGFACVLLPSGSILAVRSAFWPCFTPIPPREAATRGRRWLRCALRSAPRRTPDGE